MPCFQRCYQLLIQLYFYKYRPIHTGLYKNEFLVNGMWIKNNQLRAKLCFVFVVCTVCPALVG